jgi:hypothetical protein
VDLVYQHLARSRIALLTVSCQLRELLYWWNSSRVMLLLVEEKTQQTGEWR